MSFEEERVIAEEEKCLLIGLELLPASFLMKCLLSSNKVLLTFSTTKPSISITYKRGAESIKNAKKIFLTTKD